MPLSISSSPRMKQNRHSSCLHTSSVISTIFHHMSKLRERPASENASQGDEIFFCPFAKVRKEIGRCRHSAFIHRNKRQPFNPYCKTSPRVLGPPISQRGFISTAGYKGLLRPKIIRRNLKNCFRVVVKALTSLLLIFTVKPKLSMCFRNSSK